MEKAALAWLKTCFGGFTATSGPPASTNMPADQIELAIKAAPNCRVST